MQRIDAFPVGAAARLLGAGRMRKEDPVLPGAGVEFLKVQGDPVRPGEPLCLLHGWDARRVEEAGRPGALGLLRSPPGRRPRGPGC